MWGQHVLPRSQHVKPPTKTPSKKIDIKRSPTKYDLVLLKKLNALGFENQSKEDTIADVYKCNEILETVITI